MAPELYSDDINYPLDKSDVFALGIMLVNFITGKFPFETVFNNKND